LTAVFHDAIETIKQGIHKNIRATIIKNNFVARINSKPSAKKYLKTRKNPTISRPYKFSR